MLRIHHVDFVGEKIDAFKADKIPLNRVVYHTNRTTVTILTIY